MIDGVQTTTTTPSAPAPAAPAPAPPAAPAAPAPAPSGGFPFPGSVSGPLQDIGSQFAAWDAAQSAEPAVPGAVPDVPPPAIEPPLGKEPVTDIPIEAPPDAPISLETETNLDRIREFAKGWKTDAEMAKPVMEVLEQYGSLDLVKNGAEMRRTWLASDVPSALTYNQLYESNPEKFAALLTDASEYAGDFLADKMFGMDKATVAKAIEGYERAKAWSAERQALGEEAIFDDQVFDPDAPPDPRDARIKELEAVAKQFTTEKERTAAQELERLALVRQQNLYSTLDSEMESAFAGMDWGEFDEFKGDLMERARAEMRQHPELEKAFQTAKYHARTGNESAVKELVPILARALKSSVAAKAAKLSRLVAAETELAEYRRREVESEVRIAGNRNGGAPPAPGQQSQERPATPSNLPDLATRSSGNVFDGLMADWKSYSG